MALTAEQIGILVSKRLNLPPSSRLSIQTMIDAGLEKLARQVANDYTKRHLLLTDASTVTRTITTSNQLNYVDLTHSTITDAGVMKDYLEYGTLYFSYATNSFTAAEVNVTNDYVALATNYFPTGLRVRLTTTSTLPAGLSLNTDYYIIDASATYGAGAIQFASSRANAFAGTAVNITMNEVGEHTITPWDKETVQWSNREFGDLTKHLPVPYVYGWLDRDRLYVTVSSGNVAFAVPFIPTLTTLPTALEDDLIDVITDLYRAQSETGQDTK